MKLVPGLSCVVGVFGKAMTGGMELGLENRAMQGKEPLLPWGKIRLMS